MSETEAARTEIAVGAVLHVADHETQQQTTLRPIYTIRTDRSVHWIPAHTEVFSVYFTGMDVNSGAIDLSFEGISGPDYVVVQAYEKPAISLVWIGLILLSGGFMLAVTRRFWDARFHRTNRSQ